MKKRPGLAHFFEKKLATSTLKLAVLEALIWKAIF